MDIQTQSPHNDPNIPNSTSGSATNNFNIRILIAIVMLALVIIGGLLFWKYPTKQKSKIDLNSPSQVSTQTFSDPSFNFKFNYPQNWALESKTQNQIALKNSEDVITITTINSSSITTTDSKFGDLTFFYDEKQNSWMLKEHLDSVQNKKVPTSKAEASLYTKDGLPIFIGSGRWKTYVIPISKNNILVLNISGSGDTKPLDYLVSTLELILSDKKQLSYVTYNNPTYGYQFEYPPSWALIREIDANSSDYLSGARKFVAVYADHYPAQDFSARIDVYDTSIEKVKSSNKYLPNNSPTKATRNNIEWIKFGESDYLVEKNGQTYHVSGSEDIVQQVLSKFKIENK